MSRKKKSRGAACEGLSFRINERRPVPPAKPYRIRYLGEGVERIESIGLFQKGTEAECGKKVARTLLDDPNWEVTDAEGEVVDRIEDAS